MIEYLKITLLSNRMSASYKFNGENYLYEITNFILPSNKELYDYVLTKIKKEHNL